MAAKTENYNGKESVIVPDDEGNNNASGVGFVVTSPMNNDAVLVNRSLLKSRTYRGRKNTFRLLLNITAMAIPLNPQAGSKYAVYFTV